MPPSGTVFAEAPGNGIDRVGDRAVGSPAPPSMSGSGVLGTGAPEAVPKRSTMRLDVAREPRISTTTSTDVDEHGGGPGAGPLVLLARIRTYAKLRGAIWSAGTLPSLPFSKSSTACKISLRLFMTNGP